MSGRLEGRLARLEQAGRPYAFYLNCPVEEWPDLALESLVCAGIGQPLRRLTDDELRATIDLPGALT